MLLTTKRLQIIPMSDEELQGLVKKYRDIDIGLSKAYEEMFYYSNTNPTIRLWFTSWKMVLIGSEVVVGDLGFKGPAIDGIVEIGYGVIKKYENQGFTTEAVKALCEWAFTFKEVNYIEAETEPSNKASQRVLQKLGFKPTGEVGMEGPRFRIEK